MMACHAVFAEGGYPGQLRNTMCFYRGSGFHVKEGIDPVV